MLAALGLGIFTIIFIISYLICRTKMRVIPQIEDIESVNNHNKVKNRVVSIVYDDRKADVVEDYDVDLE